MPGGASGTASATGGRGAAGASLLRLAGGIAARRRGARLLAQLGQRPMIGKCEKRASKPDRSRTASRTPSSDAGLDGLDPAAGLAGEVLAVAAALEHVAAGAVAGVEVAHEPEAAERLEVAVDRRDVRLRDPSSEPVRDLLRRDRLRRGQQRLEHEPARERQPQAAARGRRRSPRRGPRRRRACGPARRSRRSLRSKAAASKWAGRHEHHAEEGRGHEHDRRPRLHVEVVAEVHADEPADRADRRSRATASGRTSSSASARRRRGITSIGGDERDADDRQRREDRERRA